MEGVTARALRDLVTGRDTAPVYGYMRESDLEGFFKYVDKQFSRDHASSIKRYVLKYGHLLFTGELSELMGLDEGLKRHVLAALTNLAKYLGRYDYWKELKERHGIKASKAIGLKPSKLRLSEDRMRELSLWILKAREAIPSIVDLMLVTGMRPSETINAHNLIVKLSKEGRLEEYYNEPFLEHFQKQFRDIFIRRSKHVYVSYCPREVVTRVAESKPISEYAIEDRLKRKGLTIRLKEIRKLWASYMTQFLTDAEINMLQGRVTESIFMEFYFNPNYVPNLKQRLEKGVKSLLMTIQSMAEARS